MELWISILVRMSYRTLDLNSWKSTAGRQQKDDGGPVWRSASSDEGEQGPLSTDDHLRLVGTFEICQGER
jgi:hypothetical protein